MKSKTKVILSFFLTVILIFSCGCNTTSNSLSNVYVTFEKNTERFFEWKITRLSGLPCLNAKRGDELVLSVKRNNVVSDKIYYVSSVAVDGKQTNGTIDENGVYSIEFTMSYDALKISVGVGVNEINFNDSEVASLYNVYFTDENGEIFDHIGKNEKRFLNIERNENYQYYEKDYYIGCVGVNGTETFSDDDDVERFKKEICLNEDDFVLDISGQFVYYEFSHLSIAKNFDVILKNEVGQRVGSFKQGDFLTVSVKKNTAGIRHFVYKIIVDDEQLYYSDGIGAESEYFEAKSNLFELKQDELTIKIIFGLDEIVSRDD